MRYQDEHDPVERPTPVWREYLDTFPGPFAVADRELGDGERARFETEAVNDQPWAISMYYQRPDGPTLTVRTVRSAEGVETHGTPAEDLPTALSRFIHLNPVCDRGTPEQRFARGATVRRAVAQHAAAQTPESVTVEIDSMAVEAEKLEFEGVAAVRIDWRGQTVLCAAPAAAVPSLRLRTGRREDLPGTA